MLVFVKPFWLKFSFVRGCFVLFGPKCWSNSASAFNPFHFDLLNLYGSPGQQRLKIFAIVQRPRPITYIVN